MTHSEPTGIILVDKPAGPTSHDIVDVVRRALGIRRIGHTGTLDPAATGLLILLIGRATRLSSFFMERDKSYQGRIQLGFSTDTADAAGKPISEPKPVSVSAEQLDALHRRYRGEILQTPPAHSAKKVKGVPSYKLARRGEAVPLAPKRVFIHEFKLTEAGGEGLDFYLKCSAGFYVRALAQEIGDFLGCGGHLQTLRRVAAGEFNIQDALPLDKIIADPRGAVRPLDEAKLGFGQLLITELAAARLRNGQPLLGADVLKLEADPTPTLRDLYLTRTQQDGVIGLITRIGVHLYKPTVIFGVD
jgi:tRNA pseudouridine55 synthase